MRHSIVVVAMALVWSGCSWALVETPDEPQSRQHEAKPDCTSSLAAPIADVMFASGSAAAATAGVVGIMDQRRVDLGRTELAVGVGMGLAQMMVFTASASAGFEKTYDCRRTQWSQQSLDFEATSIQEEAKADDGSSPQPPTRAERSKKVPVETAAEFCGVNRSTLRRWIGNGELPAEADGNSYVVDRESLRQKCQGWDEPIDPFAL